MRGDGSGSNGATTGVDVSAGRRVRASDQALQHLYRLIDLRKVPPGENLPSAAAISAEIGVNRMAVLQAFQMLQNESLVRVRPGRGGARVVGRDERPPAKRLARALGKQEAIMRLDLFREVLESGIARAAATRGLSEDEHAKARSLIRTMSRASDRDEYIAADVEFHELLGRASGSEMLATFATAVRLLFLVALDAVELDEERLRLANDEHLKILQAIQRGSISAAADHAYAHAASAMHLVVSELGWDGAATETTRTSRR